MSTTQQRKLQEIQNDLFSGDDTLCAKAIARCEEEGTAAMVEPLIAFYASKAPHALRNRVGELLGTLKVSGSEQYFLEALDNKTFAHIQKDLVGFMWSTGLQPIDAVAKISQLAAEGDYPMILECLTLLESIEDAIPEDQLLESIAVVHARMNELEQGDLRRLLAEYLVVLNRLRAMAE
ncbi:MAG: hypothetical protein ACK478_01000 [Flavobacteriales bacterium]|jgi:hypothetical protein